MKHQHVTLGGRARSLRPGRIRPQLKATTLGLAVLVLGVVSPVSSGQMAGAYSINPAWASSATNFPSLQAAVAALAAQGLAGPVWFNLYDDAGPFTESQPFLTSNVDWSLGPPPAPGSSPAPGTAVLTLGQWSGSSPTNRVVFRAAPGESPVLDAAGRSMGVFWNGADYVTLEGLEIRHAVFDAVSLYSEAQHGVVLGAVIRRCRIHDCGGAGVVVYGNLPPPQNTLIENNFFWNLQLTNAGGFNTLARFAYVCWRRQSGLVIRHNTFSASTGAGNLFAVLGGNPGSLTETPCADLSNNIIAKSGSPGRPLLVLMDIGASSGLPLHQDGNCYHDTSGGPFAFYGLAASLTVSTLDGWQTATGLDAGALATDPLLLDPAAGNLHLGPWSPCAGAAVFLGGPADDIDGDSRAGPGDIGADEILPLTSPLVQRVGVGTVGSLGLPAGLGSSQTPNLGNSGFAVDVTDVLPGSQAWLFGAGGLEPSPVALAQDTWLYLEIQSLLQLYQAGLVPLGPLPTGASGEVSFTLGIANDPSLTGLGLALQAAVADPGTPLGLALTNALALVIY